MNEYLLMDGTQIPVLSELAQVVGLNEAIVLQQVYYWCRINQREKRNLRDGYYWVYNSYRSWQEKHFPWWSVNTVRRTFERLEVSGLLVAGNYNTHKMDQTKWYRINFPALSRKISSSPFAQNGLLDLSGLSKPIPDIITNKNENGGFTPQALKTSLSDFDIDIEAFIDWYFKEYQLARRSEHPRIKPAQQKRVIGVLREFLEQHPDIDAEGLQEMAEAFFINVTETDWNINHFATPGILENRYLEVYCH